MSSITQYIEFILDASDPDSKKSYRAYAHNALTKLIKGTDENVRCCFFPAEQTYTLSLETVSCCRELAVRYVSYMISASSFTELASQITTASYDHIGSWFQIYAPHVGEEIFHKMTSEKLYIPEDSFEKRRFFEGIADLLCTEYASAVLKAVSLTKSPVPVQLMLSSLKCYDFLAFHKVYSAWALSEDFKKMEEKQQFVRLVATYSWLEEYKYADALNGSLEHEVEICMKERKVQVIKWLHSAGGPLLYGLLKI